MARWGKSGPEVVVVGGGAAGFFGAIACARACPTATVTILEAKAQFLTKVLISGGGRCNVTHHCFEPAQLIQNYPRGDRPLRGAFSRFQPQDTVDWFEAEGVALKTESDGRMFPTTDDSETIAEALIHAARTAGVYLRSRSPVSNVTQLEPDGFEVTLRSGETIQADAVLVTTGSATAGHRWAEKLGHTIASPVPSLFTFNVKDQRLKDLAGIAVDGAIATLIPDNEPPKKSKKGSKKNNPLQQIGPLLITHWGLSGPAVLKLSAWGARVLHDSDYRGTLRVNWLGDGNLETARSHLTDWKAEHPKQTVISRPLFSLPKRLWQRLAIATSITATQRWADTSKKQLGRLAQELVQGEFSIAGKGVFKDEFVTCGGVSLKEINFKTMESKVQPGLYFAGEVLDIDGVTGGFNFQSAWTTGWIAGGAIAESST
ncbi:MAG: NAD(P)/FAD-dependent oxidoreductase [Cyanobacteria bacterium P01_D01_bin.73]